MFNPASPLARLLNAPIRPGTVCWIGVRPARHHELTPLHGASLDPDAGIEGDHYRSRTGGLRQVTLLADTDLAAIAACLGLAAVTPLQLRRNIVVSGLNLHALKGCRFRLGTAMLEATGACHPCSRMEQILGVGGYNAVRGHGGITARVLQPGAVRLGDALARLDTG